MILSISDIAQAIKANLIGENVSAKISRLLTDSRSLMDPDGTLFFAISTSTGDGHRYVKDLYDKGVRNFVVERVPDEMEKMTGANFLLHDCVLDSLHALAKFCRMHNHAKVIAVTGSRGKTTVKEWLNRLLMPDFNITRSPRSYNSQIGVPLSVWQMSDKTELGIFEAGISKVGEMERLNEIIRPEIGIFTNIGAAHNAGFSSINEKCVEKAKLLEDCKCVIYNGDNHLIASCVKPAPVTIAWSLQNPDSKLFISNIEKDGKSTTFTYSYFGGQEKRMCIPFTSTHDFENAIHCLAALLYLGVDHATISERMSQLTSIGTRLEVIDGISGNLLIHDSYTSDFNSLAPAIDFMKRRCPSDHSMTLIISDLAHESEEPAEVYAEMAALIKRAGVKKIIGIGKEISRYADLFELQKRFFDDTESFISQMKSGDFRGEFILIKGAPDFHFEKICEMLERRRHETVLEINLDAVVENFNSFRARIRPETGIACMIKASGYGAGSQELARTLQSQGATYLAVAVHDEGVELRKAGISMPIIVLNPSVDNMQTIFEHHLEPEIYSLDFLKALMNEAELAGVKDYPVHIKIDSGMHRLGFLKEDLPRLIEVLKSSDSLSPRSIFSHLCAADDPIDDEYTYSQFEYFDDCCRDFLTAFPDRKIIRHILNSTGICRFPEHQYEMVRLGIGLYGVKTLSDGSQDDLRPVSSLFTVIISLKKWPAGTSIGYNRRGRLKRDSIIATIPVGYADGINRHLGNGGMNVMVRGVQCPSVGNICMDACMIDVTDVPGVSVGDRVEIFGENMPVDVIADSLQTIPYEVLTSISQRVKRVYYRE